MRMQALKRCPSLHEAAAVHDSLIERFSDLQGAFPDSESEERIATAGRFGSSVNSVYE